MISIPLNTCRAHLGEFKSLEQGQVEVAYDLPVLRKDGSVFHADISRCVIVYQGRRCLIGFFRNVTERKRAEEALRRSHEELQAIYSGMSDGLLIAETDTARLVLRQPVDVPDARLLRE